VHHTAVVALLVALTGCTAAPSGVAERAPAAVPATPGPSRTPPATAAEPTSGASAGSTPALALLGRLRVQGRAPGTGYSREQFGPAWADADRNGCDTRNDVLRRDLTGLVLKPGTRGCVVLGGTLRDPYTGRLLQHRRGGGAVEIDHVVALYDAWQKGASSWPYGKRVALANDPLELQAVATEVNRAKGPGDAATWLPPARSAWCAFAARQVAVKAKYGLGVTRAERDALARVLRRCPYQPAPRSDAPTLAPVRAP
jgi:hypothetical protein